MAVSIERQHRVDEMFERPRARQDTVLCHVPHEHGGRRCGFGVVGESLGALSDLGRRAHLGGQTGIADRLDGVDDQQFGTGRANRRSPVATI